MNRWIAGILALGTAWAATADDQTNTQTLVKAGLVTPGEEVEHLHGGFLFTEGPAADAKGNVFFTDIRNNRIHRWSTEGELSVFREDSGGANGLYFDRKGNLLACEGGRHRVVSITPAGEVTVLTESFEGQPFNRPNDLWITPKGGVYFTDPMYGRGERTQGGEHVYYLLPDRSGVKRVIDDMVRPNGIIGTPDGKTLYVTDHGGKKTYRYRTLPDGSLSGRALLADIGSDGMTLDERGNLYLTEDGVRVFAPDGKEVGRIVTPERPANVTFGGADGRTLFITARTGLYAVKMAVSGSERP